MREEGSPALPKMGHSIGSFSAFKHLSHRVSPSFNSFSLPQAHRGASLGSPRALINANLIWSIDVFSQKCEVGGGTPRGTRTLMTTRPRDFKSHASTYSATGACLSPPGACLGVRGRITKVARSPPSSG